MMVDDFLIRERPFFANKNLSRIFRELHGYLLRNPCKLRTCRNEKTSCAVDEGPHLHVPRARWVLFGSFYMAIWKDRDHIGISPSRQTRRLHVLLTVFRNAVEFPAFPSWTHPKTPCDLLDSYTSLQHPSLVYR